MNTTQFDIYISTIYKISQFDHMQNDEIKHFSFDENRIVDNEKFIMNENFVNENFIIELFINENFIIEFHALSSSNRDFFDNFDHDRFVKIIFNNAKTSFDQTHAIKIFFNEFNENEASINF